MGIIFLGIDPGKTGAIAAIDPDGNLLSSCMMPLNANDEIDVVAITIFFKGLKDFYGNSSFFCTLELAQAMPKQGCVSTFNYGKGFGKIQAALEIYGISFQEIRPMIWKKEFSLVKTEKSASVALAKKLFPSGNFYTKRGKMLDGLAEAALLAEWGRRKVGNRD